jgi:hypothetical protein
MDGGPTNRDLSEVSKKFDLKVCLVLAALMHRIVPPLIEIGQPRPLLVVSHVSSPQTVGHLCRDLSTFVSDVPSFNKETLQGNHEAHQTVG